MFSVREASTMLKLSESHVRLLARTGKIKAKRLGRDWVILNLMYERKRKPKGGRLDTESQVKRKCNM